MKLAFNGQGRYVDYTKGYELYLKRRRFKDAISFTEYRRAVRAYCRALAERLLNEGYVDFPNGIGAISAAILRRKPQYRGKQFIGFGKMDWEKGHLDGTYKTFGLVFLPSRKADPNLRCYGFVANRRLFQAMKREYLECECNWSPMEFNDEMI